MGGRPRVREALTRGHLRVHPGGVWETYTSLRGTQWQRREEIEQLRVDRLRSLLAAARGVPFHRERLRAAGFEPDRLRSVADLASLPPLERDDVQRLGIAGLRTPRSRGMRIATSGSSGRPVEVLRPLSLLASVKAADLRAREWHGVGPAELRLHVTGSRMGSRRRLIYAFEHTRLHHVIRTDGDAAAVRLARTLESSPPALVTGGATPLYVLASHLAESGLSIEPQAVWSGAGHLHAVQRRTVEDALVARVYQRYGGWETGVIAHECPEGRLHEVAENVIVEIVRPDGSPAAAGEVGEVLVTTLCNHAMPIVRYRLGDLAALSDEVCPCGRGLPVIQSLVGRADDLLVTGDGRYVTPDDIGSHLMTAVAASVVEFQVEQHADLHVDVRVVQRDEPSPEIYRERIAAMLDERLRMPGATRVERVDEIPLSTAGKLRHVISHAARPDGS